MRNEIEREREKSSAERHSLASQLEQAMRESKDFSALLRERDEVRVLSFDISTELQIELLNRRKTLANICFIYSHSNRITYTLSWWMIKMKAANSMANKVLWVTLQRTC